MHANYVIVYVVNNDVICMHLHNWSTGGLLLVCPLVLSFAKFHMSDWPTSYEEVSDASDHLDMSRWSESRQLPRNKLATCPTRPTSS